MSGKIESKKVEEVGIQSASNCYAGITVKQAMDTLRMAMEQEPDYAHSWHCNIAMMCYDSIRSADITAIDEDSGDMSHEDAHIVGNDAASRFMKICFGINTKA